MADDYDAEIAEIRTNVVWIKNTLESQCIKKLGFMELRVRHLESYRDENKWIFRLAGLAVTLASTFMIGRLLNLI